MVGDKSGHVRLNRADIDSGAISIVQEDLISSDIIGKKFLVVVEIEGELRGAIFIEDSDFIGWEVTDVDEYGETWITFKPVEVAEEIMVKQVKYRLK